MSKAAQIYHYLNKHIEIAPAKSEEEVQAAQTLTSLFQRMDTPAMLDEFAARCATKPVQGIFYLLAFLGALFIGLLGVVGFILGVILIVLSVLLLMWSQQETSPIASFLPSVTSQNVFAYHKGCGPQASGSKRKIVVVAHYDSGHEEILSAPAISRYAKYIYQFLPYSLLAVCLCAFLQLVFSLVAPLHIFFWIVGIICSLPALIVGINSIAARFMPLTNAANDNNASLAVLLSLAQQVAEASSGENLKVLEDEVQDDDSIEETSARGEVIEFRQPSPDVRASRSQTTVAPVKRHGPEILAELAILPATCAVEYEDVRPAVLSAAQTAQEEIVAEVAAARAHNKEYIAEIEAPSQEAPFSADANTQATVAGSHNDRTQNLQAEPVTAISDLPVIDADLEVIATPPSSSPVSEQIASSAPANTSAGAQGDVASSEVLSTHTTASPENSAPGKAAFTVPEIEPFEAPEDPFTSPVNANIAQRASLFDLPDPSTAAIDPLALSFEVAPIEAVSPDETGSVPAQPQTTFAEQASFETLTVEEDEPNPYVQASSRSSRREKATKSEKSGLFHRKKQASEEPSISEWIEVDEDFDAKNEGSKIGSWDNFADDDDDFWKGGATADGDAEVTEGELADAVVNMDTAKLVAHDIFFVATGASDCNHVGMKDFIKQHKHDIRGAYIIDLEAIGAGTLTTFTQEGRVGARRSTRRILTTLERVARDLHISLDVAPHLYTQTEGGVALHHSLRATTLMGCDVGEVPALVHTNENIAQNVDVEQIENVQRLVAEVIRRV